MIIHPFPPIYDKNSRVLILGSFPSVKSREQQFFYGHPQNRFWKVISAVFSKPLPHNIDEKRHLLLSCGVALWDVVYSCDVSGSSDSTIKNVVPNDILAILEASDIRHIFVNGKTAEKLYNKYIKSKTCIEAICLPSTSPANAVKKTDDLIKDWQKVFHATKG